MLTRSHGITALSEIDDIAGRPVVDRELVFAISHSGVMAAIQLDKGDRQWSRDIGGIQTPWVAGDYVFVIYAALPSQNGSKFAGRIACQETSRPAVIPASARISRNSLRVFSSGLWSRSP